MKKILILVLLTMLLGWCKQKLNSINKQKDNTILQQNNKTMEWKIIVKKWDKISVDYIWYFTDWKVFDTSIESEAKKAWIYNSARQYKPLEFVVWAWQMIKCFDNGVIWMNIWETKEITCKPEEAYWKCDPQRYKKVQKSSLKQFEKKWYKLEKWTKLPTQYWMIEITDSDENTVTLNFNNPMCWKTLKFKVTLRKIEK